MKIEIYLSREEAGSILIEKCRPMCPPGEWVSRVHFDGYSGIEITFEPEATEETPDE